MFLADLLGETFREDMTIEELSEELEKLNVGKESESTKLKAQLSKANSEAASYKKQLREKMTEAEKAEADRQAQFEALQKENETLKRDKLMGEYFGKLKGMGYADELAKSSAEALISGDMITYLENQAKHNEAMSKQLKADSRTNTPRPGIGASEQTGTDYQKELDRAIAEGNMAEQVYFTRLIQQSQVFDE